MVILSLKDLKNHLLINIVKYDMEFNMIFGHPRAFQ